VFFFSRTRFADSSFLYSHPSSTVVNGDNTFSPGEPLLRSKRVDERSADFPTLFFFSDPTQCAQDRLVNPGADDNTTGTFLSPCVGFNALVTDRAFLSLSKQATKVTA
jgi:hypothetical protein